MADGTFTDSPVEDTGLAWLEAAGWQVAHGPDFAPDIPSAELPGAGQAALANGRPPY
jgi:type I restriction enzyme R subunit